ncbi:MAG: hypothetical protein SPL39_09990 [Selenomonadaceae bacterium]|nr:hypothetical protein [Selenomonadaceae bacterium]
MWKPTQGKTQPLNTEGIRVFTQTEKNLPMLPEGAPSPNWRPRTPQEYADEGYILISVENATRYPNALIRKGHRNGRTFEEEGLKENNGCVYVATKKGDMKLTDFVVRVESIKHKHTQSGVYDCLVLLLQKGNKSLPYEVKKEGYRSLAKALRQDHPEFKIFPQVDKCQSYFESYLARIYDEAIKKDLPETDSYDYAGWQMLSNGQMYFFSGLDEECTASLALVPIDEANVDVTSAVRWLFHLVELGEPQAMWPIFLYKFTGVLAKPFSDTWNRINFVLNICGPTGTGKTTISRPMYGDFDPDLQIISFRASAAGADHFIESKYDAVTVLDDLSNAMEKKSRELFEHVLRQFGDSNGRVMASSDGGVKRISMRGGIVITSESLLEGIRQSSELRLLVVPITKTSFSTELCQTLTADAVRRKRKPKGCYSQMDIAMTAFIRYVSYHYEEIVDGISLETTPATDVHFRRLQNVYALLLHIGSIVYDFGAAYSALTCTKEEFMQKLQFFLTQVIQYNDVLGLQADPATLFLKMIVSAIKQNLLPIALEKDDFAKRMNAFIGYFESEHDGRKLKIDPDRTYEWMRHRCRGIGLQFSTTPHELQKKLLDAGFSEGYQQKNHASKALKQVTINGNKLSLLVLRWDVVLAATETA